MGRVAFLIPSPEAPRKTAEAARVAMIERRRAFFMANLRAGILAEDNIEGAKLDIENTPKGTRLNCILPQKSRLLGLVGRRPALAS